MRTSRPLVARNTNTPSDAQRVLIVKSNLEPFRLPFYAGLEQRLARENVQLRIAAPESCCGGYTQSWLVPVSSDTYHVAGRTLVWQRVWKYAKDADLIIAQQCARELANYVLLARRRGEGYKLALWGHGREFQRTWTTRFTEFIKWHLFDTADFWFAYTPGVAKIVESTGYPPERICTVFNSIDTNSEVSYHRAVAPAAKSALRTELGMGASAKLVSYCGGLYQAKRLDYLLQACRNVRTAGVDLHLAVLGDGPDRSWVQHASQEEKWIHLAGEVYGMRKALYLATSECMAIPGVIGLAVVDAFAHECPLVTTSVPGHGPEVEYLLDQVNGVKTADNVQDYGQALLRVLKDEQMQTRLRQGCREAATAITIENMIEHFAAGVVQALRLPARS